jgi:iron complex transport system ATP-binding protein
MSNGKLMADGRKEEILTKERLGEVFGIKVEVARKDGYYHAW